MFRCASRSVGPRSAQSVYDSRRRVSDVPFSLFFCSCSGVRFATPLLPAVVFFFFLPASSPSGEPSRLLLTTDSPPGLGATSSEGAAGGGMLQLVPASGVPPQHSWRAQREGLQRRSTDHRRLWTIDPPEKICQCYRMRGRGSPVLSIYTSTRTGSDDRGGGTVERCQPALQRGRLQGRCRMQGTRRALSNGYRHCPARQGKGTRSLKGGGWDWVESHRFAGTGARASLSLFFSAGQRGTDQVEGPVRLLGVNQEGKGCEAVYES